MLGGWHHRIPFHRLGIETPEQRLSTIYSDRIRVRWQSDAAPGPYCPGVTMFRSPRRWSFYAIPGDVLARRKRRGFPSTAGNPAGPVRFQDRLSRCRRGGFRPSTGSVLWHRHVCSHPQASHRPAVSQRGSLPSGRTSRFLYRLRSRLLTGLAGHRKHGWSAARIRWPANGMRRNP